MCQSRFEPLLIADWDGVLMIHYEVDADELQHDVPFSLDLHDGHAYVTVVAFTMRRMRPALGGSFTAWALRPIASHDFLNVRTYVRVDDEIGIHFLAEWVSSRLAVMLGPCSFALPYRHGRITYQNEHMRGPAHGCVQDARTGARFEYHEAATAADSFAPCELGSLDEWLMERYSAFNCVGRRKRFFRVWHPPWQQRSCDVELRANELLVSNWNWFDTARYVGANLSPGLRDVWLGWPRRVRFDEINQPPVRVFR